MNWRPDEVRACSLSDFAAAIEGWGLAQGRKRPLRQSDVDELDALTAEYGGRHGH